MTVSVEQPKRPSRDVVPDKSKELNLHQDPNCSDDTLIARTLIGPGFPSATVVTHFGKINFGEHMNLMSIIGVMNEHAAKVKAGDLSNVEAMLVNQATALDTMFAELVRRAAANMGSYLDASEKYMRMALKAQNQARMTLETLANVKNPPVVYAKQANIANGPQQVNNTLHAHTGQNQTPPSKLVEQPNETPMDTTAAGSAGTADSQVATVDALNRTENE